MATTIKVGTVFIQDRPRIFRTLALESEPYAETWDVASISAERWLGSEDSGYWLEPLFYGPQK